MNERLAITTCFAVSGLVSGLLSGASVLIPGAAVFTPGIFFGIALVVAINVSLTSLTPLRNVGIVMCSQLSFFAAMITAISSAAMGNDLHASSLIGAVAGTVGASLLGISLLIFGPPFRVSVLVFCMPTAGFLFGGLFMFLGVAISDHTTFGHPWDDFVAFPLWQAGVAACIPLAVPKAKERRLRSIQLPQE